jgi:glycogen synthase
VRLSVYGRGESSCENQLKQFAQEQRLNVSFASAGPGKMPDVYRDHDLLVFPSEWAEPFALTPLEATARGLPVVGTTTGGSAELFRHGENGLVYTAGCAEELAERIRPFAADYAPRARCARTAYREAREPYAAPVVVGRIEEYLRKSVRHWRSA